MGPYYVTLQLRLSISVFGLSGIGEPQRASYRQKGGVRMGQVVPVVRTEVIGLCKTFILATVAVRQPEIDFYSSFPAASGCIRTGSMPL